MQPCKIWYNVCYENSKARLALVGAENADQARAVKNKMDKNIKILVEDELHLIASEYILKDSKERIEEIYDEIEVDSKFNDEKKKSFTVETIAHEFFHQMGLGYMGEFYAKADAKIVFFELEEPIGLTRADQSDPDGETPVKFDNVMLRVKKTYDQRYLAEVFMLNKKNKNFVKIEPMKMVGPLDYNERYFISSEEKSTANVSNKDVFSAKKDE